MHFNVGYHKNNQETKNHQLIKKQKHQQRPAKGIENGES